MTSVGSFSPSARGAAKSVDDLKALTGLKDLQARQCMERFSGYAGALASFAQSFSTLGDEVFEDRSRATANAATINTELRAIYAQARELKVKTGKTDAEVWRAYYATQTPSVTPAAPATSSTKGATFGSGFIFGGASSSDPPKSFTFGPSNNGLPPPGVFGFSPNIPTETTAPAAFASFGTNGGVDTVSEGTEPPAAKPSERKPVTYCEATHFTGPYFEMPLFWEEEVVGRAPLLNLNMGFLEVHKDDLRSRLLKWVTKSNFYNSPLKYVKIDDEDDDVVRVIIKDAERTFFHPDHREKMVAFLHAMYHEFNAYGQAMSYLAGLCMLVLSEVETASIIRFVSKTYIKGHWAAEAVGFATSAWVVEYFMQNSFPDVAMHLQSLNFWPDTYLQKILTGLCVHVLRFKELFDFLDAFMEGGLPYLIQFCLAVVEHFRSPLLSIKSTAEANELYEIMRLDPRSADQSDIVAILARAPLIDLGEERDNIDVIRSQMFDNKVQPRLKKAPKTDTYEPCEICEVSRPKWWNEDLGAICDVCKEANPEVVFEKY